jgi:hypothetical protein
MFMKKKILIVTLAVLSATIVYGQTGYLVPGVGTLGDWDTYVELANPFDQPIIVALSEFAANAVGGCDFACNVQPVGLPPHGNQRITIENGVVNPDNDPRVTALAPNHVFTLFIASLPDTPDLLPVAHVHAVNRVSGDNTEFPIMSFAASMNRPQPTRLTFPGASHTDNEHCNLILTSIRSDLTPITFSATLQLQDSGGTLLATKTVSAASTDCLAPDQAVICANTFLHDVVTAMGVSTIENGVLDVTQTTGGAAIWGHLDCVQQNGSVITYTGANP